MLGWKRSYPDTSTWKASATTLGNGGGGGGGGGVRSINPTPVVNAAARRATQELRSVHPTGTCTPLEFVYTAVTNRWSLDACRAPVTQHSTPIALCDSGRRQVQGEKGIAIRMGEGESSCICSGPQHDVSWASMDLSQVASTPRQFIFVDVDLPRTSRAVTEFPGCDVERIWNGLLAHYRIK